MPVGQPPYVEVPEELIPVSVAREIIGAITETSVVLARGRRQTMPTAAMTIPVLKALPTSGWVNGIGGRKPTTEVAWTSDRLQVEEVAALIAVPEALLDDAGIPVWSEVRQLMVDAVSWAIDAAILFGVDAPPSFVAQGAGGVAGQAIAAYGLHSSVAPPGQPDLAEAINLAMQDVENTGMPITGHAADISIAGQLRGLRATDGQPIFAPALSASAPATVWGHPISYSAGGAFDTDVCDLLTGNWNNLVIGIRQDLRVDTSTEAVITDDSGQVLVNAFQDDQIIMRVHMRLGYVVGRPLSRRTGERMYPFSAVKAAGGASGESGGGTPPIE
jgi:HK97 family phage major capsid protein